MMNRTDITLADYLVENNIIIKNLDKDEDVYRAFEPKTPIIKESKVIFNYKFVERRIFDFNNEDPMILYYCVLEHKGKYRYIVINTRDKDKNTIEEQMKTNYINDIDYSSFIRELSIHIFNKNIPLDEQIKIIRMVPPKIERFFTDLEVVDRFLVNVKRDTVFMLEIDVGLDYEVLILKDTEIGEYYIYSSIVDFDYGTFSDRRFTVWDILTMYKGTPLRRDGGTFTFTFTLRERPQQTTIEELQSFHILNNCS